MRAIYVDPNRQVVEERDVNIDAPIQIHELVPHATWGHWRFPECLPEHDAFVDQLGLQSKRRLWFFGGVHVWGPVLILGRSLTGATRSATVSEDFVRQHTSFA